MASNDVVPHRPSDWAASHGPRPWESGHQQDWIGHFLAVSPWSTKPGRAPPLEPIFNIPTPFLCAVCKRGPVTGHGVSRCVACGLSAYCHREHQKLDWPRHKRLCKLAKAWRNNASSAEPAGNWETWWARQQASVAEIRDIAAASGATSVLDVPHSHEASMWFCRPHCMACYATSDVKACQRCAGVAFCAACRSDGATSLHSKAACDEYFLAHACLGMIAEQGSPLGISCLSPVDGGVSRLPTDWLGYLGAKAQDFEIPASMIQLPPVFSMLADSLSLPMTILHALKAALGTAETHTLEEVNVHLLGAAATELVGVGLKMHELYQWLPGCARVCVTLVGTVIQEEGDSVHDPGSDGRRVTIRMRNGLYHDIADSLGPATIVAAQNSGLHDPAYTATWKPTLARLAAPGAPVSLWTSYDGNEMAQDAALLLEAGLDVVGDGAGPNAFRGLRPFVDVVDDSFYYSNAYRCVCRPHRRS